MLGQSRGYDIIDTKVLGLKLLDNEKDNCKIIDFVPYNCDVPYNHLVISTVAITVVMYYNVLHLFQLSFTLPQGLNLSSTISLGLYL